MSLSAFSFLVPLVAFLWLVNRYRRETSNERAFEDKFRAIFNQAAVGIAQVGLDGRWITVNQRACEMIGYGEAELLTKTFQDITHPDDLFLDLQNLRRVLADEIQTYTMEKRYLKPSGDIVWINLSVSLVRDRSGNPDYFISVIEDITEHKTSNEALSRLRETETKLRANAQEKEILLQEIHHRVKNNLHIISSLLDLQSDMLENAQAREAIKLTQSRIRSIALIHEKLYRAQNFSRVDFGEYIEDLLADLFQAFGAQSRCRLTQDMKDAVLSVDKAIPCGLIVTELVTNALKYAFPDNGDGEIFLRLSRDLGKRYTLTVADNGVGFPGNFDFRNSPSLGLQLVMTLVDQLEGTIELAPGPGTAFQIHFACR